MPRNSRSHAFPPATSRPSPHRPPTREEIDRARTMYAEGFTVSRILAATDMSLGTLYHWLDGGPFEETPHPSPLPQGERGRASPGAKASAHTTLLPPLPRRKEVLGKRRRALKGDRVSLAARLWRTAERQVRDIEERLARPAAAGLERERDTRMLAVLVRTLRDLSAFDPFDLTDAEAAGAARPADDDPPPQDIEEFRMELVRRIKGILAADNPAAAQPAQQAQEAQQAQQAEDAKEGGGGL